MNKKIKVYSKNNRIHDSLITIFSTYYYQVITHKWQIWIAFKKDFVSSYRNTSLGFIWSIILPLIPVTVYIFLGYIKVFNTTDEIPYIYYIVLGTTLWFYMSGTIISILTSIQKEKSILAKVQYPLIAVLLSNFGKVFYDLLLRLVLVVILFFYYNIDPHMGLIYLPILFIIVTIFSLGVGMILVILNEIYSDIQNFVTLFLNYGLFVSSVIFPMPEKGLIGDINFFNPFNTFIVEFRNVLVFGEFHHYTLFSITSFVSFVLFIIGLKIVYIMEYRIKAYL